MLKLTIGEKVMTRVLLNTLEYKLKKKYFGNNLVLFSKGVCLSSIVSTT